MVTYPEKQLSTADTSRGVPVGRVSPKASVCARVHGPTTDVRMPLRGVASRVARASAPGTLFPTIRDLLRAALRIALLNAAANIRVREPDVCRLRSLLLCPHL